MAPVSNFFDQFDAPATDASAAPQAAGAPAAGAPEPSAPPGASAAAAPVEGAQPPADIELTLGDRATDVVRGLVGGSRDAIQGLVDTGLQGVELATGPLPSVRSAVSFSEVEKQTTVVGQVTRDVMKWVVGLRGLGKAGMNPTTLAGNLGKAGVAGYAFTDPHTQNLGNLVEDVPLIGPIVQRYLAQDPKSSDTVNKLRGALENVLISSAVEPMLIALKAWKGAKSAASPAAAKAIMEEAGPKIDAAVAKAAKEPVELANASRREQGWMAPGPGESAAEMGLKVGDDVVAKLLAPGAKPAVASAAKSALPVGAVSPLTQTMLRLTPKDHEVLAAGFKMHGVEAGMKLDLGLSEGAINYKNILTSQDGLNILSDVVSVVRDKLPAIAGQVTTLDHVKEAAALAGRDATGFLMELHQTAGAVGGNVGHTMAVQLNGAKMVMKRTIDDMVTEAGRIGVGLQTDRTGLAHMADLLTTVMNDAATVRYAGALTTASGRIKIDAGIKPSAFADLLKATGGGNEAIDALAARIRLTDSLEGVAATVRGTPPTWWDKGIMLWNHVWMNGVLGGLKTTFVNVGSTGLNAGLMPGYRFLGGALSGNGEQMKQALYQYHFLRSSFGDSLSMAARAFKEGTAILDPSATSFGTTLAKGATEYGHINPNNVMAYLSPNTPEGAFRTSVNWGYMLTGWAGRFLNSQDEFFKQLTFRSHMMASGTAAGVSQGLEGKALKEFVNARLKASLGSHGQALRTASDEADKALLAAREATFTQDLNQAKWFGRKSIGEIMEDASNSNPVVKGFVLPFTRVPTNLARQTVDMTPGLNLFRKQNYDAIMSGTDEQRAMALGKMGFGAALWAGAGFAAYEGRVTGSGPTDKDLQRQARGGNWAPYSLWYSTDADGTRNYISLQRLQPFTMFLGVVGDWADLHAHMDPNEKAQNAELALLAVLKNATNQTYLKGITNVVDALMGDEAKLGAWVRNYAGSLVPSLVQSVQPDDELKIVRSALDAIQAKVPGWSLSLEAKRDNFGAKIRPPQGYPYNATNPFTMYSGPDDPVRNELSDLARSKAMTKFPLPNPIAAGNAQSGELDLRDVKNPKTGQSAYDRWMELHEKMEMPGTGQTLHEAVGAFIETPEYKELRKAQGEGDSLHKDSLASDVVRKIMNKYEIMTWNQVSEEYKEMGLDIGTAKQEFELGGKAGRVLGPNSEYAKTIQILRGIAGEK